MAATEARAAWDRAEGTNLEGTGLGGTGLAGTGQGWTGLPGSRLAFQAGKSATSQLGLSCLL